MNSDFSFLDSNSFYTAQDSDSINKQYMNQQNSRQGGQSFGSSVPSQSQQLNNPASALSPMFITNFNNNTSINENSFSGGSSNSQTIQSMNDANSPFYSSFDNQTQRFLQGIPISKFNNINETPMLQADSPFSLEADSSGIMSSTIPKPGISNRLDMFPSLLDHNVDTSPSNSVKANNIDGIFGSYTSSGMPTNPHNNRISELQNMATSPVDGNMNSLYSTSLPIMNNWAHNIANFKQSNEINALADSGSLVNSPAFPMSNQATFSPGSPFSGSLDFRDSGLDNKRAHVLNEKRRRRRESHNAVERRRRDYINEQIQELYNLLPPTVRDPSIKPNKGLILRKAVAYIKDLKSKVPEDVSTNYSFLNSDASLNAETQSPSQGYSSGLAAILGKSSLANNHAVSSGSNSSSRVSTSGPPNSQNSHRLSSSNFGQNYPQ
ncbi:Retrograde regulation protein 3 [Smittium mucronatum]|uniref:Retrograde regulation protein 3 n=1 Tax=Smittium mucronatum TaxID=133383 RepID=A0A1R0H1N7_9FUNG|nr:Retrograde regulation protein 3 [Smittium mucronatum]